VTSGSARYVAGAEALDRLGELMAERERLERETRFMVDQARRCRVTWSEIGEALGVSQQAASKRFGSGAA
jgi:phosphohistidine phosphatase SixA